MLKFFGSKSQFVICFCLVLFALFSSSSNVFATSASLSTSGTVNVDIMPSRDGSVGTSISASEVNVVTNCRAGYNLSIFGPTDRNLYRNGDSANNTQGQYLTPVDGTSTLKNTSNAWGYSLSANTDSGVFSPLSNTPTLLKTTAQTASQTDIDDDITIYYGVSVSNSLNPGTYEMANNGSIVYQLTMDPSCIDFEVMFNPNGGTGTMSKQNIIINESTKLSANSFTAPAMGTSYQNANGTTIPATANKLWTFWGWNTAADGTGDWYKDRESVTNLANQGETITLYAQWKQATLADLNTPTSGTKTITHNTMQDMSPATCYNSDITTKAALESANKTGATTLTDNRDGIVKSYDVSKLADGNCWMTTNLALGTTSEVTLTSDDTDLAEGTTFVLPAGDTTSSQSTANARIRLTNSSGATTNGVYYSWAAAVASTISTSSNPATSICPKNWDLPSNGQFGNLATATAYSSTNPTTDLPSQFLITGKYTSGETFSPTDEYGFYWTSTSYNTYQAYGARLSSSELYRTSSYNTQYGGWKYNRKNIRCVTNQGTATITYDSNNGSGSTSSSTVEVSVGATLAASSLFTAESHKQFKEWNTQANGGGTSYAAGTSIASTSLYPGQSLALYAIWDDIWTLSFVNTDGGTTRTKNVVQGNSTTVAPTSSFSRSYYELKGWDTSSAGANVAYTNGQSITPINDMTFYTVWKPIYKITYDINTTDPNAEGAMGQSHANLTEGTAIGLYASNFSRKWYGFAGWSFDPNAQPGGSSAIYGPNEVITAPVFSGTPGPDASMTLYAIWVQSSGNLQGWTGCNNMSIGSVIALTDQRDDDTYAVAKLVDGKCWMIENLRLDNDTSDNTNGSLAQGYGSQFVGLANPEGENYFGSSTAANSLYSTDGSNGTMNLGGGPSAAYKFPRFNNYNTTNRATNPTNGEGNTYSYGNYYTWAAAIADAGLYSPGSEVTSISICPSGWRLPMGGDKTKIEAGRNEIWDLVVEMNNGILPSNYNSSSNPYYTGEEMVKKIKAYPNNFVASGYIYGSIQYRDRGIYYWTATSSSSTSAYLFEKDRLYLEVYPGTASIGKSNGVAVRCIIDL